MGRLTSNFAPTTKALPAARQSQQVTRSLSAGNQALLHLQRKPKPPPKAKPVEQKEQTCTATEESVKSMQALVNANNKSKNFSSELLLCLIWQESAFKAKEKGKGSSARGLMQITKPAVQDVNRNTPKGVHFTYEEMTDPAKNIQAATYYLDLLWNRGGKEDAVKTLQLYRGISSNKTYSAMLTTCETCTKGSTTHAEISVCLCAEHT